MVARRIDEGGRFRGIALVGEADEEGFPGFSLV